jgi:hypothetical protein
MCLFIIGIIAYRRNRLTRIPDAMGQLWLGIALVWIVILTKAISASAYTAYVIHAPIVVLFTLTIRNITLCPL